MLSATTFIRDHIRLKARYEGHDNGRPLWVESGRYNTSVIGQKRTLLLSEERALSENVPTQC